MTSQSRQVELDVQEDESLLWMHNIHNIPSTYQRKNVPGEVFDRPSREPPWGTGRGLAFVYTKEKHAYTQPF